jgi:mRNA interferase MazF
MNRGEVWTVAGGSAYSGKPRPAVIVQSDLFAATASVVVCPLTTDPSEAPIFRPLFEPTDENGLRLPCRLMVDKLTAVPRARLGRRIGEIDDEAMSSTDRALLVFLGLV